MKRKCTWNEPSSVTSCREIVITPEKSRKARKIEQVDAKAVVSKPRVLTNVA